MAAPASSSGWRTARVLAMGLELGVLIGGMTYLGSLGDDRWKLSPWLTLAGCLAGLTMGVGNLVREIKHMDAQARRERQAGTDPRKPS